MWQIEANNMLRRVPLLTAIIIVKTLMADSLSSGGVAREARSLGLFQTTPLVESLPLSKLCNRPVYLKLDLLQQSGSFKDRGMAHLCATTQKVYTANRQREAGGVNGESNGRIKVISSSGGNAGLAVTTVARKIPQMDVSGKVIERFSTSRRRQSLTSHTLDMALVCFSGRARNHQATGYR